MALGWGAVGGPGQATSGLLGQPSSLTDPGVWGLHPFKAPIPPTPL